MGELEKSIENYNKLLDDQQSGRGFLGLGNICLQSGQYEEAKLHLVNALKRDEKLFEAWAAIGIIYYLTNQPQRAINSFTNAIQNSNKKHSDLYSKRAATYLLMEKWDEAFKDASQATHINPDELHAYLIKGKKCFLSLFYLD